jgi:tRNA threonylcarbamoyladenosine biosynthesis protein TsaE
MQDFFGGKVFTTNSPDETEELGRGLAERLTPGDVLALVGELGSGKTRFVQGIAHIDLFRISSSGELDGLGLEEYIYGKGISVIEWADRAMEILPEHALIVKFSYKGESEREIEIEHRREQKSRI